MVTVSHSVRMSECERCCLRVQDRYLDSQAVALMACSFSLPGQTFFPSKFTELFNILTEIMFSLSGNGRTEYLQICTVSWGKRVFLPGGEFSIVKIYLRGILE